MIDRDHSLSISRQAQLVGISRGSVYYKPRAIDTVDLDLMRHIDELHLEHPFMGARMLRDQLNRKGFVVGRKHVSTLMKRMGVEALIDQKIRPRLQKFLFAVLFKIICRIFILMECLTPTDS